MRHIFVENRTYRETGRATVTGYASVYKIQNLTTSWPDCRKYLYKFWFRSFQWFMELSSSQDFYDRQKVTAIEIPRTR